MRLSQGTILADRYEIIEQIGIGGMAVVYRALDKKLDRDVTVKVMREEYSQDESFISRFNIEARAAASLSNSNIVNVYDVGLEDNINYMVMEFIDGVTLKELINRRAPFENEETLGVAIQIATGLSHAHENNIIHRDIKPQNIMVTKSGMVKVTDFGIARAASAATTTTTSNTMGSVHYFSPEQARGKYVDFRSDIYSLGIVMFEMATGEIPYDGDSAVTVALKHINEPLPDMRSLNPNISESIYKIIHKATSKLSSQRYDTIDDMISDLKRALTNESGEFVKSNNDVDSPTIILGEEDLEAIRNDSDDYYEDDLDQGRGNGDADRDSDMDMVDMYEDDDYYHHHNYEPDSDDQLDKNTERKIIIAAILTALAIIAVITAIGFRIYRSRSLKADPVATIVLVPRLEGYSIAEAEAELGVIGLDLGDTLEEESNEYAPGLIIRQNPAAETEVEEGTAIDVTVSIGVEKVEMPSVINKIWDDDKGDDQLSELSQYDFDVFVMKTYDDNYPEGTVLAQEPMAGVMVERGMMVTLTVSRGVEIRTVAVPRIIGRTEEEASRTLQKEGLANGQVTNLFNDDYAEGIVFNQLIPEGTEVEEGAEVGYYVSKGPEPEVNAPSEAPSESVAPSEAPPANTNSMEVQIQAPRDLLSGDEETVNIKVIENNIVIVNQQVTLSDFPMNVTINGNGWVTVAVLVNDKYESTADYDLSGN